MAEEELKSRALEMLEEKFNPSEWIQAYTDGSADSAVRNGGSGVFVRFPGGRTMSSSIPVGVLTINYTAELTALFKAAELIHQEERLPPKVVFLTDCRSVIQKMTPKRTFGESYPRPPG